LAGQDFPQRGSDFQAGEAGTKTVVGAVAKRQVSGSASAEPKLVGLVECGGVAVGCCDDDKCRRPSGSNHIADGGVFGRSAQGRLHRTVQP
jgi:hypothetical protein